MSRPSTNLSTGEGFLLGGAAACAATSFSNPAEVAKTRLQLQGELARSGTVVKVYNNVFDVFAKTWRNEGVRGVQRGLVPSYGYQVLLNGSLLGLYQPFRKTLNRILGKDPMEQFLPTTIAAGTLSGVVGATVGNPLFLVKVRMQAYSPALPVGAQRFYRSSFHALQTIYRAEGLRGFARGVDAAILRTSMGASVQLPSYNWVKKQIAEHGLLPLESPATFLISSALSATCVCAVMQPADTALTRMYNQPTTVAPNGKTIGLLYRNPLDCLWKTLRTEGILGWYKGTTAHFLRIFPHVVLVLTANDIFTKMYRNFRPR